MKTFARMLIISLFVMGCSSSPVVNKWVTPAYRTFVVADGISSDNYVRIVDALVESNKFFVVDRSAEGFGSAVKEQNLERVDAGSRFNDTEKYARLGKLFGVGSLIVARSQCFPHSNWFKVVIRCREYLGLIATSTGEVIATAESTEDDSEGSYMITYNGVNVNGNPSWVDAVNKLNDAIPSNLAQKIEYSKDMLEFRQTAAEDATREKEQQQQGVDLHGGLTR